MNEEHTNLILKRYENRENVEFHPIDRKILVDRYLSKVMTPSELKGRTIFEIGAGCSTYVPLFMDEGCKKYYANDIIPERLAAIRVEDPRYCELPGDFLKIDVPEDVDMIFAALTMMLLVPMFDEFVDKISSSLSSGQEFISMDANYFCPYSIYRRFADKRANPVRLFSPFSYAKRFEHHGFEIEKLVPFTGAYPFTTGNWMLGTTFWLRARKK